MNTHFLPLCVLTALFSLLAACGGGGGGGSSASSGGGNQVAFCSIQTLDAHYSLPTVPLGSGTQASVAANPLYSYQWHLQNRGASGNYFSGGKGEVGKDINLDDVHTTKGIFGDGVSVIVVDDGLEKEHPDLDVKTTLSYNFVNGERDPTPPYNKDAHGTGAAGIIAMTNNSTGGVGIAPGVDLYGRNLLGKDSEGNRLLNITLRDEFYALGLFFSPTSETPTSFNDLHVFNNSWGYNAKTPPSFIDAIFLTDFLHARAGRSGRGYVYVKSAGNGFDFFSNAECSDANSRGVSCQNASFDVYNSLAEFIVVGALSADGPASSYSSSGANLWVSAPGGEYGYQDNRSILQFVYDSGSSGNYSFHIAIDFDASDYEPTILTTDLMSCDAGNSNSDDFVTASDFEHQWNASTGEEYVGYVGQYFSDLRQFVFQQIGRPLNSTKVGPHSRNPSCNYTSTYNGTSAAAPMITGVVALMLEANPNLTWRDVKHILANTSIRDEATLINSKFDNSLAQEEKKVSLRGAEIVIDPGWTTNNAGYRHSSRYGFGRVDAKAAVDMAQDMTANNFGNYNASIDCSNDSTQSLSSDTGINTITSKISLDRTQEEIDFIEHTRITLTFEHTDIENTQVVLISPSGTRSILHWPIAGGNESNSFDSVSLASSAFYGETAHGEWTLEISDVGANVSRNGVLHEWHLDVRGH